MGRCRAQCWDEPDAQPHASGKTLHSASRFRTPLHCFLLSALYALAVLYDHLVLPPLRPPKGGDGLYGAQGAASGAPYRLRQQDEPPGSLHKHRGAAAAQRRQHGTTRCSRHWHRGGTSRGFAAPQPYTQHTLQEGGCSPGSDGTATGCPTASSAAGGAGSGQRRSDGKRVCCLAAASPRIAGIP